VREPFPSSGLPPRRPGFEIGPGHVGFVVGKVALGQIFSEHIGFPCQFSLHRLLHTHHLSPWAGTVGQLVADVPSGLSLTPTKNNKGKYRKSGLNIKLDYRFSLQLLFGTFFAPTKVSWKVSVTLVRSEHKWNASAGFSKVPQLTH
jgi:hypothetical protein